MDNHLALSTIGRWSQHRLRMRTTTLQKTFELDYELKSSVTG